MLFEDLSYVSTFFSADSFFFLVDSFKDISEQKYLALNERHANTEEKSL